MSAEDLSVHFNTEELVVARTAADLVVRELKALRFDVRSSETDEVLALTLIEFSGLADWEPPPESNVKLPDGRRPAQLDVLLAYLRSRFADRFGGWVPVMAKNRIVGGVGAANGQVSGGGEGEPEPKQPEQPAARDGVPAEVSNAEPHLRATGYVLGPADAGQHCRVALLDTRLSDQPGLLGKILASQDTFLSGNDGVNFEEGHATFVVGLIVQQAPAAKVHAAAVLTGKDSTNTAWNVARAMANLAGSGIDVLNLSLGCFTEDDQAPFVLQRAVDVLSPRTVIVAAAGNHANKKPPMGGRYTDGKNVPRPFWPAALDNVIAVGARKGDPQSNDAETAAFSPKLSWVDLEAPGVKVTSLYLKGAVKDGNGKDLAGFDGYASWSGTSLATATVTGVIAAAIRPGKTAAEVVRDLREKPGQGVRPCPYN
jgi:membrane-anchored mycosin MYCP